MHNPDPSSVSVTSNRSLSIQSLMKRVSSKVGLTERTLTMSNTHATTANSIFGGAVGSDKIIRECQWRNWSSIEVNKQRFLADDSIPVDCEPSHVEFRALLEIPIAWQCFYGYCEHNIQVRYWMDCWRDIQKIKSIVDPREGVLNAYLFYVDHIKGYPSDYEKITKRFDAECIEYFESINCNRISTDKALSIRKPIMKRICCWHILLFNKLYFTIYANFIVSSQYERLKKGIREAYNHVEADDFEYISEIGRGAFGVVVKCRKISTGRIFAMKIQSKKKLLEFHEENPWRAMDEMHVMAAIKHPFIMNMSYAFHSSTLSMIVMSLAACDFRELLLQLPDRKLNHEHIVFYAAEIASALLYMHKNQMIYRDLKPGNILLDELGHVKLGDLGSVYDGSDCSFDNRTLSPIFSRYDKLKPMSEWLHAKTCDAATLRNDAASGCVSSDTISNEWRVFNDKNDDSEMTFGNEFHEDRPRATTVCGTLGYMAPELMIMKSTSYLLGNDVVGYTNMVDWWSLGSVLYKLYTGKNAFACKKTRFWEKMFGRNRGKVFTEDSLANHKVSYRAMEMNDLDLSLLEGQSKCTVDFLRHLLQFDPVCRLGGSADEANEIKQQEYFGEVQWDALLNGLVIPPPIPIKATKLKLYEKGLFGSKKRIRGMSWSEFKFKFRISDTPDVEDVNNVSNVDPDSLEYSFRQDGRCDEFDGWEFVSECQIAEEIEASRLRKLKRN